MRTRRVIKVLPEARPWWAPWRRTVTLECSKHGVFITGLVPLVTEYGFDFVEQAARVHQGVNDCNARLAWPTA